MSLTNLPCVSLVSKPTPLHELPNLSARLGGPRILIKREDLTGFALGGNKTRQLEFIMADLKQKGYDAVISTAGSQSNWCLQLAAAARKLNMEAGFVLFSGIHPEKRGNLLLHHILGSNIRILEGQFRTGHYWANVLQVMDEMADDFRRKGRKPAMVNFLFKSPYSVLAIASWVDGAEEIWQQLQDKKIDARHIILAQGSGTQPSGLIVGFKLLNAPIEVIGISVSRPYDECIENVVTGANETAKFLEVDVLITPNEVTVYSDYMGEGYGIMTKECIEAIRLVAQTEGIFLDPVYTGKAMAGLIDLIHKGRFTSKDTVLFIQTGGLPALFVYDEALTS